MRPAARTAADWAPAATAGVTGAPPGVRTTSVKPPSPRWWKRSRRTSRPRSASDPGTLKRFVSRLPRLLVAYPPSTNRIAQTTSTARRCATTRRVHATSPGISFSLEGAPATRLASCRQLGADHPELLLERPDDFDQHVFGRGVELADALGALAGALGGFRQPRGEFPHEHAVLDRARLDPGERAVGGDGAR